jgi:hypothetical protein
MNNGKIFHDYLGTSKSHGLSHRAKGHFIVGSNELIFDMDNGRVLYSYQGALKSYRIDHGMSGYAIVINNGIEFRCE